MTTTTNLAIELIDVNQSQKEVVANEAFSDIDAAICDSVDVEVTDGTNSISAATMREAQRLNLVDGSPTAAFGVVLASVRRLLIVTNSTAYDATVSCSGAGEALVTAGASRALYCDGVDVFGLTAQAIGGAFINLSDAPASYSGAANKQLRVNGAANAIEFVPDAHAIPVACSDETTELTTGVSKVTFRMPYAMTLTAVRASVTTAPTGSAVTVDINESGVSILSTKLTIDAGEKTSTTAVTPAVISNSSLSDDAEITIDIDAVGSTIAGAGLKVYLVGRPT
jgi:hypothetical protein